MGLQESDLRGRTPAFRQEVVEELRIAAHDPQHASRALDPPVDVVDTQDLARREGSPEAGGAPRIPVVAFEQLTLPSLIGLQTRFLELLPVLRGSLQQLEVDQPVVDRPLLATRRPGSASCTMTWSGFMSRTLKPLARISFWLARSALGPRSDRNPIVCASRASIPGSQP